MSNFEIKRTTWSVLPAALEKAGRLAFPECKSPRTVPDNKWEKLVMAYKTWWHIMYSDELCYSINRSMDKQQQYLNNIALKIAEEP